MVRMRALCPSRQPVGWLLILLLELATPPAVVEKTRRILGLLQ